jgi:hypothetical protein
VSENPNQILADLVRRAGLGAPIARESRSDGGVVSLHVQRRTGQLWLLAGRLDEDGAAVAAGIEPVATAMLGDMLVAGGQVAAPGVEVEVEFGTSRRRMRANQHAAWLALFEHASPPGTLRMRAFDAAGKHVEEYSFAFGDQSRPPLYRLWSRIWRRLKRYDGRRVASY